MKVNVWNKFKIWLTRQLWKKQYPTKDDWERVNAIDWEKIATQVNPELHGSLPTNAYTKSYNSFSGSDLKLYYVNKLGEISVFNEAQAFSFLWKRTGVQEKLMTLIAVLFDQSTIPVVSDMKEIYLLAANEFGVIAQADFLGVKLLETGYGISIDDIISEENHTLSCEEIVPLRPVAEEDNIAIKMYKQRGLI